MELRILDSNIIIYAIHPKHHLLKNYLQQFEVACSKVSMVEVLGYHALPLRDRELFDVFFSNIWLYDLDDRIFQTAIRIRQSRKMTLGDSLIAATSMVHQVPLLTHNTQDFQHIQGLSFFDPFDFV